MQNNKTTNAIYYAPYTTVQLNVFNIGMLTKYIPDTVVAMRSDIAVKYLDKFKDIYRMIAGSTIANITALAQALVAANVWFDAICYAVDNTNTPLREQVDPIGAFTKLCDYSHSIGKLFIGCPDIKYMSTRKTLYPALSALCDGWIIQSQYFQSVCPPGELYRQGVQQIASLVVSGNGKIPIQVQVSGNAVQVNNIVRYATWAMMVRNVNQVYLDIDNPDTLIKVMVELVLTPLKPLPSI